MSDHSHNDSSSNFLIGVIVGAAITYLYTSKSGQTIRKELFKDVAKTLENLGEEIEEKEERVVEKIEKKKVEVEKQLEDKLEEVKENAQGKMEDISREVKEEIREVPQQAEKIQKKGRKFFFRKSRSES